MKKIYLAPMIYAIPFGAELMQVEVTSTNMQGKSTSGEDMGGSGGDPGDDVTPTAKPYNVWEAWD